VVDSGKSLPEGGFGEGSAKADDAAHGSSGGGCPPKGGVKQAAIGVASGR
jgi:hypothetical protein